MKKIKTLVEIAVCVAWLPLLIFAEKNQVTINSGQYENVPAAKNDIKINESARNNSLDIGLPGLISTKFIVINY